jgi:hypothetical protein
MAIIQVESIHHAISKGMFIELARDYRTSRTVKAFMPDATSCVCAISTAAFSQHIQQGTARERQSKMEALCIFVSQSVGHRGKPSPPEHKSIFFREDPKPDAFPLKLEWYAPDKYWVVLLPDEQIQTAAALA